MSAPGTRRLVGALYAYAFLDEFVLLYPRGIRIQHLDLYRLDDPDEVWELGWSELGAPDELVMIELPVRAESLLPEPRWEVEIEEVGDPSVRRVAARPVGEPNPLPAFPGGGA